MACVFLHNINNILGESLVDFFLKDENTVSVFKQQNDSNFLPNKTKDLNFLKNPDDLKFYIQDENIFLFNTKFLNEIDFLNENYAASLCENLNEIFDFTNNICKFLIETGKKGKFVFITVNPTLGNIFDFPIAPINDEAIHSFVKSLVKEITPFNILVNAVCIDPIFEMLDKEQLRNYRKKMRIYSIQKSPTRIQEILDSIRYILANDSHLFSGKIYYLGEGM